MHFHAGVHTAEYVYTLHIHTCAQVLASTRAYMHTHTQIHLLLLSLLPQRWTLIPMLGYIEPQEHLKLIWFYSTSICAQLPESPCHSHFLKWKSQVLVSSTLPEEEERRDLSAGDTEEQSLNCIMFSKIILPPKTAGCPLIKGYLILYLQHPVGRDTALCRSSHLVNSHSGALWNLCINATHGNKQSP